MTVTGCVLKIEEHFRMTSDHDAYGKREKERVK